MGSREGWSYGSVEVLDHMAYDGLTDAYDRESMGASTERLNPRFEVTREQQDRVAALSHQRAAAARDAGIFDAEIVAVEVAQRRGPAVTITTDEGIRDETTEETLAVFARIRADGSITAGNASQISDGAAAVVLTTRAHADASGWPVLAVGAAGQVAGPDNSLHAQPARAIAQALQRQQLAASDLDLVEINEAFGAVVARSQRELGVGGRREHPRRRHRARAPDRRLRRAARRPRRARARPPRFGHGRGRPLRRGGQGEALILTR
jgi:acetyl-CoA C-acetyltransferase